MRAWDEFLTKQESQLGKQTVDKWLRPLKIVHFDSGNLYLEAQEDFQISWFEEHIRPLLKSQLTNNNFRPLKVHVHLKSGLSSPAEKKRSERPEQKEELIFDPDKIDPAASLDNFVETDSNRISFRLICELTGYDPTSRTMKSPSLELATFNPIFILGASGTGKTHLLMALTNAFKKRGLKALYARVETFTDHFVKAIRNSDMQRFRSTYRNSDILLFDDVHALARKDATQEEFFHLFNALHMSNRQVIMTSQQPPSLLSEIEARLISRFEWGILLHLTPLEKNALSEVLDRRCEHFHFSLSLQTRNFLIDTFPNAHALHRALEALILRIHLQNNALYQRQPQLIDKQAIITLLSDLIEQQQQNALTPQKILSSVSSHFGMRVEDILTRSQAQENVFPRQIAMYLCRTELKLPFAVIGRLFSRDHSTVMTSVKYIQQMLAKHEPKIQEAIRDICKQMMFASEK